MKRASGYNALMAEVCVGMGFCGGIVDDQPLHVDMFVPESGPVTAEQFIDWLFKAEGMTREDDMKRHKAALLAAFVRHMGCEAVDAALLKWDVP